MYAVLALSALVSLLYPVLHPQFPVPTKGSVVITGCSPGGLGYQLALEVLKSQPETIKVMCTVRSEADSATLMSDAGDQKSRLGTFLVDVTDRSQIIALGESLKGENVVAVVNNAGYLKYGPFEVSRCTYAVDFGGGGLAINSLNYSQATEFRQTLHVNLFGLLDVTQTLLPHLLKQAPRSRIVNIGSMAGTLSRAGTLAYSTSKKAVEGASDAMRLELGRLGVSVSLVQPGFFSSKMCTNQQGKSQIYRAR